MNEYMEYLRKRIPEKDSLKLVKSEAKEYYKSHSLDDCFHMGLELYQSDNFQIQEVGVFLLGYSAHHEPSALSFLKNTVSRHDSWKVQEILAMAFDNHCRIIGYEAALPIIKEWLGSDCANVRRAVSEGLRVWTSRPYFKDNPKEAIQLLSAHKEDDSAYVRKSVGNALRDISRKHPQIVAEELNSWELSSKEIRQVYKLAGRFLDMDRFEINTERLVLKPLGTNYLKSTIQYAMDGENTKYMYRLPYETVDEAEKFLADAENEWKKEQPQFLEFAVLYKGIHIGAVSVYFEDDTGELSWILNKNYWGNGLAFEAAGALIHYVKAERKINRFSAHCDAENIASYKIMEKLGMKKTGEFSGRRNRSASEDSVEYHYELY